MSQSAYNEAKSNFLKGDYILSKEYFLQNDFMLEYAYCLLMQGDAKAADQIFYSISNQDLRANWAHKLIQFINGYVNVLPSFFQIRNFLEIDLNLLIKAGQAQFVENIINGDDYFYSVNQESYKFIARVMLNNGYEDLSLYYLLKAKDKFYYDPEMQLMLAGIYINKKEFQKAKSALDACLSMLPDYYPAKKLYEKLV